MLLVWRKNFVIFLLTGVILCITLVSYNVSRSDLELSIYQGSRPSPLSANLIVSDEWTCKPLDHVFFLKLHKCGSSTVQNILMRRGLHHNQNFVLPEKNNYLGHPDPFDVSQIGSYLMDHEEHFDIFTHHSRLSAINVRAVMPPDTKWITILREPSSLFESLFHYYHFQQMLPDESLDLEKLLEMNDVEGLISLFESVPRLGYRIGHNQMAYDFGLSKKFFRDEKKIGELLEMIDREFDLVLLSEYMEVSMVLLADMMCWPLEEVTFLKLNARPADAHHTPLSTADKVKIRQLNNVDTAIYEIFRAKFKNRVLEYGEERMQADVTRLIQLNQMMLDECVAVVVQPKENATRFQYPVTQYQLHYNAPSYCRELTLGELRFTDRLRTSQRNKFEAKAKLRVLLHT